MQTAACSSEIPSKKSKIISTIWVYVIWTFIDLCKLTETATVSYIIPFIMCIQKTKCNSN